MQLLFVIYNAIMLDASYIIVFVNANKSILFYKVIN